MHRSLNCNHIQRKPIECLYGEVAIDTIQNRLLLYPQKCTPYNWNNPLQCSKSQSKYGRQKRANILAMIEFIPINRFKKRMEFYLSKSIKSQSILRLALNQSVDKVYAVPAPSKRRNLMQLYLFRKHFLSNLFSICPNIRPLNNNQFTFPVINSKAITPKAKKSTL